MKYAYVAPQKKKFKKTGPQLKSSPNPATMIIVQSQILTTFKNHSLAAANIRITCILSSRPVLSILLATFTVLPQISYWGFVAPITPATTGPIFKPVKNKFFNNHKIRHKKAVLN